MISMVNTGGAQVDLDVSTMCLRQRSRVRRQHQRSPARPRCHRELRQFTSVPLDAPHEKPFHRQFAAFGTTGVSRGKVWNSRGGVRSKGGHCAAERRLQLQVRQRLVGRVRNLTGCMCCRVSALAGHQVTTGCRFGGSLNTCSVQYFCESPHWNFRLHSGDSFAFFAAVLSEMGFQRSAASSDESLVRGLNGTGCVHLSHSANINATNLGDTFAMHAGLSRNNLAPVGDARSSGEDRRS